MDDFIKKLEGAIELEIEGHDFYAKCSKRTKDKPGREMFEFLAGEELNHREWLESEYRKRTGSGYTPSIIKESDIFPAEVMGGKTDEKADKLDALNIGIEAEKRSIELYANMLDETNDQVTVGLLRDIMKEEEKHLAILEKEVEFVTQTGEYTDFRAVSF